MHEPSEAVTFGALLRGHRSAAGLTQEELAERAGLSRRGIADLERGVRQTPYADTVDRLASALGLSAIERKTLVAAARVRRSDASERRLPPTDLVTNSALYRRVFVGREAELRELRAVCDRVLGGSGELALVVGEPGIGKTAVCGQLADYAGSRGMATLVGHLYEEGFSSLPYLPFVEALREYVLHGSVDELRKQLGHLAPEVGRLLPEVCQKLHVEPRPTRDPEEDRWRLLTAVTEFLQAATRHRPLMLLLEDVQWADRGTLDLLLFLSRRLAGSRLLLVCTYRDVEVDRAHPLAGALAELRRGPEFTRVLIRGLDTNDVSQILMHLVGGDVDVAFADAVQRQTEGNPLFVQEVARYLVEEGVMYQSDGQSLGATTASLMTRVPEGVREVIGKRLSKLSPECNQALSAAAVIGREFGLGILQQVIDLKEDVLLETLEHAQRARVLDDTSIEGEVRFRFNHALFRQTLYKELFTPRRVRLHQRVARVLEAQYASHLEDYAAELSEHFAQSRDPVDLEKARQYAELAAARATRVSAHGDAVRHLRSALHLLGLVRSDDDGQRCDLLLALGQAMLAADQGRALADDVAPEAFRLADRLGDRQRAFTASLLASSGLATRRGLSIVDTPEFGTWAARMDRVAEAGSPERIIADIGMAASLWARGNEALAHELTMRAVGLARGLGQLRNLPSRVIEGWAVAPHHQRQRLDIAHELVPTLDEPSLAFRRCLATLYVGDVFLTWGQREKAQAVWAKLHEQFEESRIPYVGSIADRVILLTDCLEGQVRHALELADALERAGEAYDEDSFERYTAALYVRRICLYAGDAQRALAGFPQGLRQTPVADVPVFGFAGVLAGQLALCLAYAERVQDAQAILQRFLEVRTIGQQGDETSMPILIALLEAAVLLDDKAAMRVLVEPLKVAANLVAVDNSMTVIARHLGAAEALLGNHAQAIAYTRQAIEVAEKVHFRPELALARLQLAELLSAAPDDSLIAELESMHMQPAFASVPARPPVP